MQKTPVNIPPPPQRLSLKQHLLRFYIQGLILVIVLMVFQLMLDSAHGAFMQYMPPIGFFFYLLTSYLIQPIIIGVLNIIIIHKCAGCKGWQVGFWLNGFFLLLAFSTFNFLLKLVFSLSLSSVAAVDVVLLAFPFGCLARYSNGGWNKPID